MPTTAKTGEQPLIRLANSMSGFTPDTADLRSASATGPAAVRRAVAAAALAASAFGFALVATPQASAAGDRCTITGTSGNDVLRGTAGNDVICGLTGNDTIYGLGGNDVIKGGTGSDRIAGDGGNDVISGEAGNDSANGGSGNDVIQGDSGNDTLVGGSGNDRINGDAGNDSIDAATGSDFANGGDGGDRVAGGPGDDALQGGAGTDRIIAGSGSDTCAPDRGDAISGSCEIDIQAPVVQWLDVPATVTAGTTLTVTFSLKDKSPSPQGVPAIWIGGAPGWITSWCGLPIDATLVSGTTADGVWSISCPVPDNAVNDPYSLHLNAYDAFGNRTASDTQWVTVVGGASDNQAPTITDLEIPETAKPGETVTLTWRAADPSGVKDTPYPWVYRPSPQFGVIYGEGVSTPVLTSGTAFDGTWSQSITLPTDSVPGNYRVWISVRDELGNKTMQQYGSFEVPSAGR